MGTAALGSSLTARDLLPHEPIGPRPAGGTSVAEAVRSYSTAYLIGAGIQAAALPFILLARREKAPSDPIDAEILVR